MKEMAKKIQNKINQKSVIIVQIRRVCRVCVCIMLKKYLCKNIYNIYIHVYTNYITYNNRFAFKCAFGKWSNDLYPGTIYSPPPMSVFINCKLIPSIYLQWYSLSLSLYIYVESFSFAT